MSYDIAMARDRYWHSKTLQELERQDWGAPETGETPMVSRILGLRRKRLSDLADGDLRLLVAQNVGFPYTAELAVQRLAADPMLESDFYPRDLLAALARVDGQSWARRPDLKDAFDRFLGQALQRPAEETKYLRQSLDRG